MTVFKNIQEMYTVSTGTNCSILVMIQMANLIQKILKVILSLHLLEVIVLMDACSLRVLLFQHDLEDIGKKFISRGSLIY